MAYSDLQWGATSEGHWFYHSSFSSEPPWISYNLLSWGLKKLNLIFDQWIWNLSWYYGQILFVWLCSAWALSLMDLFSHIPKLPKTFPKKAHVEHQTVCLKSQNISEATSRTQDPRCSLSPTLPISLTRSVWSKMRPTGSISTALAWLVLGCCPTTQVSLRSYSSLYATVTFPPLLLNLRVTPQYKPLYTDIKLRGRCLWLSCFGWPVKFAGILNNSSSQALGQKHFISCCSFSLIKAATVLFYEPPKKIWVW